MTGARPSLVRARIVQHHGELRAKLEVLQRLAIEADGGDVTAAEHAVALTHGLFEELADHLDIEEQLLVPMLREVDAWGELRANELLKHHELQWAKLKALRSRAVQSSALAMARDLALLVTALRRELLDEDRELLTPDVLRDDVVGIDVEDS
jgi:iron-sulfur cluster repair protein YtfE (RIC family)